MKRNRGLVMTASGMTAAVVLGLVVSILGLVSARVERNRALAERNRALAAERKARAAEEKASQAAKAAETALDLVSNGISAGTYQYVRGSKEDLIRSLEVELAQLQKKPTSASAFAEANVRFLLGKIYRSRGFDEEALAQFEYALALRRKVFSGDHPRVAEAILWFAIANNRDMKLKEQHAQEALDMYRRMSAGQDSEGLAHSLEVMASIVNRQGRPHDALALARESVAIGERITGFANLGFSYMRVAECYRALADPAAAETNYREAINVFRRQSGTWGLTGALMSLASLQRDQGKLAEATALLREATKAAEQSDRRDWASGAIGSLGSLAADVRDYEQCELYLREVLANWRLQQGNRQSQTAMSLYELHLALELSGRTEEAHTCRQELRSLFEQALKEGKPLWSAADDRLALAEMIAHECTSEQDLDTACNLLEETTQLIKKPRASVTAWRDYIWSRIHWKRGDLGQAVVHAKKALDGCPHKPLLRYRFYEQGLVELCEAPGDLQAAEDVLRSGIELRRRELPKDHPEISFAQVDLASLLFERGALDEAERLLMEAQEKLLGHDAVCAKNKRLVCDTLARLYKQRNKSDQVAVWEGRAATYEK